MTPDRRLWRPTASLEALRRRADVLAAVRRFFRERGVLEVETPALGHAPVPDVHLASFEVRPPNAPPETPPLYLQTSPEYAMKRLLAAGSGPIFQICRAFRAGEAGSRHNPEFTMLEWYRPGWTYGELMDEVEALVASVLGAERLGGGGARRLGVAEAFSSYGGGVDAHQASAAELERSARGLPGAEPPDLGDDRLAWLDYLASFAVEPALEGVVFLYDYPQDQAALARVRERVREGAPSHPPVAERFELYVDGVELANGWTELTDPAEQRRRFEKDLAERRARGLPAVPLDERFLAALEEGMPDCAGVALGLDRLVMLALEAGRLEEVWAFPGERA